MKKPALFLLALAVPVGLVLWLRSESSGRGGAAERTPHGSPEESASSTTELSAAAADLQAAEGIPSPAQEVASRPKDERREQLDELERGAGRTLHGRVRIPAGAPDDPTLRVIALEKELSPRQVYGNGGVLADLAGEKPASVLGTAAVAAGGRFDLALPTSLDVWFVVDGRYLYSPVAARAAAGSDSIDLAPKLGACLTGRVLVPAGTEEPAAVLAGVGLELSPTTTDFSMSSIGTAPVFERKTKPDAEGRFELRAIPEGVVLALEVESEHFAAAKLDELHFVPGQLMERDVTLNRGATVRGRVVAEGGAALEGAEVVASRTGPWGFPGGELAKAKSGADGVFELTRIAPGKCVLRAQAEGRLESELQKLQLADEETRDGLVLELGLGASIAGRVRLPDGAPCAGAKVEVDFDPQAMVGMGAMNAVRGSEGEATSGPDGAFSVSGLGKGPFQVIASVERTAADGVAEKWRAKATSIQPGTDDLELRLAIPLSLTGRVVDEGGAPVTECRVHATAESAVFFLPGETRDTRVEDEAGVFVLRGLDAGTWKVEARADGFGPMQPLEVELPRPDQTPVELVLQPAATIAGKVLDPRGAPISGAKVTLVIELNNRIAQQNSDVKPPEAISGDDGAYLLTGLATGKSTIHALHERFATSEPAVVEASAAAPAEDVVLKLRDGGRVTGEVFGTDGKHARGVQVVAQETGIWEVTMKRTDGDGRFTIERMTPGSWTITALLEGAEVDPAGSEADVSATFMNNMRFAMVQLDDGEEEHVVLGAPPKDPVWVSGRVRHAGAAVESGVVTFVGEGTKGLEGMKMAPLRAEGRYEVELPMPGRYVATVQVTAGGGTFQQHNVEYRETIPETERHELDFQLPLGSIRGRVLGPGREPMAAARVTLSVEGAIESGSMLGGHYSEATTDPQGHYSFDYLRPGTYIVAAGGALFGGAFGTHTDVGRALRPGLEVVEGESLEGVDFELEQPGEIRGKVVDSGGGAVKDASIFVRDDSGYLLDRFSMITSAGDGTFTYTGVASGEYVVSARAKGMASLESSPVRVGRGESASVELVLQAGTQLLVEVVDADDQELQARVSVLDSNGHEMHGMLGWTELASSLSDGLDVASQRIGPLPPGSYTVEAVAADGRKTAKPLTLDGQAERRLKLRLR